MYITKCTKISILYISWYWYMYQSLEPKLKILVFKSKSFKNIRTGTLPKVPIFDFFRNLNWNHYRYFLVENFSVLILFILFISIIYNRSRNQNIWTVKRTTSFGNPHVNDETASPFPHNLFIFQSHKIYICMSKLWTDTNRSNLKGGLVGAVVHKENYNILRKVNLIREAWFQ